jgi:hypothetical protein
MRKASIEQHTESNAMRRLSGLSSGKLGARNGGATSLGGDAESRRTDEGGGDTGESSSAAVNEFDSRLADGDGGDGGGSRIREVIRSNGLVFSEKTEMQFVLSKPKIMALKSRGVENMEKKLEQIGELKV